MPYTIGRLSEGVAPIVSSIIMLLVALTVISSIYVALYVHVTKGIDVIRHEILEARRTLLQSIDIGLAIINASDKTLHLIISTGQQPVKIVTVYVNDTYIGYDLNTILLPDRLHVVKVDLSKMASSLEIVKGAIAHIKVIYEGGVSYAYAEVVE